MIGNLRILKKKVILLMPGDEEIRTYDLILKSDDVGNKSPHTWDT